jgi:hypothetical protein
MGKSKRKLSTVSELDSKRRKYNNLSGDNDTDYFGIDEDGNRIILSAVVEEGTYEEF